MVNKRNIDNNLKPFHRMLLEIKEHSMASFDDAEIKVMSQKLKVRVENGEEKRQLN